MKALIISPTFPPTRSGGADLAFNLCERLADRGVDVQVVTSRTESVVSSTKFHTYPIMRDWSWQELRRLLKIARQFRPDVIEIHFAGSIYRHHPMISFLPRIMKRLSGNPRVVLRVEYPEPIVSRPQTIFSRAMEHAMDLYRSWNGLEAGYGTLLRDSDSIIVLCDSHAALLATFEPGIDEKCVTIPPPPSINMCNDEDGSVRKQTRRELQVGPADTLLAYYGYVYPNKGLETLFEALALVAQKSLDVRLLIVGGVNEVVLRTLQRPEYLGELKQRIESLGVSHNVIWTGYFPVESEEPSALLRAADICVLPFDDGVLLHRSSFGVAAVHGKPIVTTRGKDSEAAFIDGENVLLCPPNDAGDLAERIQRLRKDFVLREKLALGVRELAEKYFSWKSCIDKTIEVFNGGRPGNPARKP